MPTYRLLARRPHHPFADGDDKACLLRKRYELLRPDNAKLGMLPSNECFGTDNSSCAKVYFGLIVKLELLAFDRLAEAGFEVHALHGSVIHRLGVELEVVTTEFFGPVHRTVGIAN